MTDASRRLERGDAALVERDPALPGLATALDPAALAALLREHPAFDDHAVASATYVRYKPGTSCLVGYEVQTHDRVTNVYVRTHRHDAPEKLRKAVRKPDELGVVVPELALAVHVFPNDRRLRALRRLTDAERRRKLLRSALAQRRDLRRGELELLRYKPERRFVARIRGGGGDGLLKAYAGGYARAVRAATAFASTRELRVPALYGLQDSAQITVVEWIEGGSLSASLVQHPQDCEPVGAALAALHSQRPDALKPHSARTAGRKLNVDVAAIADLLPDTADAAGAIASEIHSRIDGARRLAAVHGDFSADQVVIGHSGGIGIVDLDEAALADPLADLGSFCARLDREVLAGHLSDEAARAAEDAILRGYSRAAPGVIDPEALAAQTAAGVLRLAVEPFRLREPDWPERTRALLARAQERLDG